MGIKNLRKIIVFYPSYENGGATKILQNIVTFCTEKKIKIHLISFNANYSNFECNKKFLRIIKPKILLSPFFFERIFITLSVLKVFIKEVIKVNKKNTIIFSMQSHLFSVLISKIFNKKIIIRNSEDPFGATKYADNKFQALIVFLTKFITFNLANGIITNSSVSYKGINFFLINKKKIKLILNPYLKKIYKNKSTERKKNTILAIGRLTKQKNFPFLISAFKEFLKKHHNYKLVLIGSGNDKKKILNQISSLKLKKKIVLMSWKKKLSKYFINSKFFILPSLYEGSPNILIEAVNTGIPCISSDCSGSADILLNGKIGIIYKKNNKQELISSMIKMHKNYYKYQINSIKFMRSSKRFLIKPQSQKYLNFISKFTG